MESKFKLAEYNDPSRYDYCREGISAEDRKNGLLLHIKVAPRKIIHPDTGEVLGVRQVGPENRYMHARPCAEKYSNAKLICTACNYWVASPKGAGLCLCVCHPPRNSKDCKFSDGDLERAGGK